MSIRPCIAYTNRTKTKHDTSKGTSCPSSIGHALKELQDKMKDMYLSDCDLNCDLNNIDKTVVLDDKIKLNDNKSDNKVNKLIIDNTAKCPECKEPLAFEGGCNSCKLCGWSKCDL